MEHTGEKGAQALRADIQALRGLAVSLVVLQHAQLGGVRAGYLGVDIFFVISGYLITGLVARAIEAGSFSLCDFYFRRAKRLLPAAYATILATAVLSAFLLTEVEYRALLKQVLGAVTFTANIALWKQTDYFSESAQLKPLLHMWSLSIEEQYYLCLPVVLVLLPRRFWGWATAGLLLVSLGLALATVRDHAKAVFYLMPTRAWEIALGSFGALALDQARPRAIASRAIWLALAALAIVPVVGLGERHPGPGAVVVCAATLIVILARQPALQSGVAVSALAKMGQYSYSLYLVHWPVFAFLSNAYAGEDPPVGSRLAGLALATALSYLVYRYVETPGRLSRIPLSRALAGRVAVALVALILLPAVSKPLAGSAHADYAMIRRHNFGFSEKCETTKDFHADAACRNSEAPQILVWGDSFGMHLVPGISSTTTRGVVQATRSACGPFLGLAPLGSGSSLARAQSCLSFNRSVLEYLSTARSVEVVVLSSPFDAYVESGARVARPKGPSDLDEIRSNVGVALTALRGTVEAIRALGKRVVVVAPPPSANFDIGLCAERRDSGRLLLGAHRQCELTLAEAHEQHEQVQEFLRQLPESAGVSVIDFDAVLCPQGLCHSIVDGVFIYRDRMHLSYEGSVLVARSSGLSDRIWAQAR